MRNLVLHKKTAYGRTSHVEKFVQHFPQQVFLIRLGRFSRVLRSALRWVFELSVYSYLEKVDQCRTI
jgi:hypothetical protein